MKKRLVIIISIIVILSIICFFLYQNDKIRFKISYEYINIVEYNNGKTIEVSIPFNNPITYLKEQEVIDFLENGTGIVYFGYNTCPWCRNIIEPLFEVAGEENIDTIYYVDVHNNIKKVEKELLKKLDAYLKVNEEINEKRLAVPDVYFIKNGKIVSHHIGTVDSYKNPYKKMNDSQKEELKSIYRKGIKEIY